MSPKLPRWSSAVVVGLVAAVSHAQPTTIPEPPVVAPADPVPPAGAAAPPVGLVTDPLLPAPPAPPATVGTVVAGPTVVSDPILSPAPKRWEILPTSLLWEPLLAVKRDPRTGFTFSDVDSRFSRQTADPSIGTTFGIARFRPEEGPLEWQLDMFAVVHSRFSSGDYLTNTDYRTGVLSTARVGNWAAKFGVDTPSTHIGDEAVYYGKGRLIGNERDEAVLGLNYLFENQLRVYGHVGWAFWRRIGDLNGDTRPDPFRYDIGFDWYKRQTTGRLGQPFAALNVGFDGATNYDVTFNAQVGWMWKVADRRLSQFRVYAEFFSGPSPFGQSFDQREQYAGFGFALDY